MYHSNQRVQVMVFSTFNPFPNESSKLQKTIPNLIKMAESSANGLKKKKKKKLREMEKLLVTSIFSFSHVCF